MSRKKARRADPRPGLAELDTLSSYSPPGSSIKAYKAVRATLLSALAVRNMVRKFVTAATP